MSNFRRTALAACALLPIMAAAAHADLKVTQRTTIQNPQLSAMIQSMSPAERAQMAQTGGFFSGGPVTVVIYLHGDEARVDLGAQSTVINLGTHKMFSLDRKAHTYTVSTYTPQAGPAVQATVHDTGPSQVILGHRTRRYQVAVTAPSLEGGRLTGDVWSAPDLPALPTAFFAGGPAAALQSLFHSIKGLPLKINALLTGTSLGNTAIQSSALSLSKNPLPLSVFQVPHGYRRMASSGSPSP